MSSFHKRLLRFAKKTTLVSVVWTVACMASLLGWQIGSWIRRGEWYPNSLSSLVELLQNDKTNIYTTASVAKLQAELIYKQAVIDWLLAMPAIAPLFIATALLSGFYLWLSHMERQSTH